MEFEQQVDINKTRQTLDHRQQRQRDRSARLRPAVIAVDPWVFFLLLYYYVTLHWLGQSGPSWVNGWRNIVRKMPTNTHAHMHTYTSQLHTHASNITQTRLRLSFRLYCTRSFFIYPSDWVEELAAIRFTQIYGIELEKHSFAHAGVMLGLGLE